MILLILVNQRFMRGLGYETVYMSSGNWHYVPNRVKIPVFTRNIPNIPLECWQIGVHEVVNRALHTFATL